MLTNYASFLVPSSSFGSLLSRLIRAQVGKLIAVHCKQVSILAGTKQVFRYSNIISALLMHGRSVRGCLDRKGCKCGL